MARLPPDPDPIDIEYVELGSRDLFDDYPPLERATTQIERSFGPSCLLSLIIVVLLLIVIKRFIPVSWTGMACLAFFIWFGVLMLLVRWRPDRVLG